jgi:hypothetical protein
MESTRLPFSLPNVYQGFAVGSGIATATSAGLILEFEIKDNFVGALRTGIQNISIPITELYSVVLKAGWFRTRLFVTTRSMTTLNGIPGSETGKLELRIARKDRAAAAGMVSMLMLSVSAGELARLEGKRT